MRFKWNALLTREDTERRVQGKYCGVGNKVYIEK